MAPYLTNDHDHEQDENDAGFYYGQSLLMRADASIGRFLVVGRRSVDADLRRDGLAGTLPLVVEVEQDIAGVVQGRKAAWILRASLSVIVWH